jgi:hypothetical protein
MPRERNVSVLHILLLLTFSGLAFAQPCSTENANTDQTIAFLIDAKDDSQVTADCVTTAIHKLYHVRSKEAIEVLVEYLDFEREPDGIMTGSSMEPFPAVDELFALGRPVLPALIHVVAGSASKVARDNAVKTIMLIYRDDPPEGIRLLLSEAAKSQDPDQRTLLRQAASSGLRWCQGKHRNDCESALSFQ